MAQKINDLFRRKRFYLGDFSIIITILMQNIYKIPERELRKTTRIKEQTLAKAEGNLNLIYPFKAKLNQIRILLWEIKK